MPVCKVCKKEYRRCEYTEYWEDEFCSDECLEKYLAQHSQIKDFIGSLSKSQLKLLYEVSDDYVLWVNLEFYLEKNHREAQTPLKDL